MHWFVAGTNEAEQGKKAGAGGDESAGPGFFARNMTGETAC